MKLHRLSLLVAVALLGFLLPAQAQSSKALEAFKADLAVVSKFSDKVVKETTAADPAAGVRNLRSLVGRLRKVRTDGLPDDLKSAFIDFVAEMGKMERIFAGFPETGPEFTKFIQGKVAKDPEFVDKLGPALAAREKELAPVAERLDVVGKKYGIEDMKALKGGN